MVGAGGSGWWWWKRLIGLWCAWVGDWIGVGENKRELRPLGGLKMILECLNGEDVESRRYALASLINLSNDRTYACA